MTKIRLIEIDNDTGNESQSTDSNGKKSRQKTVVEFSFEYDSAKDQVKIHPFQRKDDWEESLETMMLDSEIEAFEKFNEDRREMINTLSKPVEGSNENNEFLINLAKKYSQAVDDRNKIYQQRIVAEVRKNRSELPKLCIID